MTKRIYISLIIFYPLLNTHHSFARLADKTRAAIFNSPTLFNTEPFGDTLVSSIHREMYLMYGPKLRIADFFYQTKLDKDYKDAIPGIRHRIENSAGMEVKVMR